MRAFNEFSCSSGLVANAGKSKLYCGGVSPGLIQRLKALTGFEEGTFPMRYLGVPMSPKKWSKSDCWSLVLRLCNRIDCWTNQHLSYAGRLQLVRTVLSTLHNYWASVFLLPASILKEIDMRCRTFLWGKKASGRSIPLINWQQVCVGKKYGGLGIHDSKMWNIASLGMQVWNISQKKDSL